MWHLYANCADALGGRGRGCQGWSRAFNVEELLQWDLPGTVSIRGGAPWGGASPGRSIDRSYFKRAGPTAFM